LSDLKKSGFTIKDGKIVKDIAKKSKYGNSKIEIDGFIFDSTKEGNEYSKLKLLKKSVEIKDFEIQVKFDIRINEIHIANYFLDFLVINNDGSKEYIDVKGQDKKTKKWITTDVFQLKKKLVEAIYKIKIKII
jgi:hypothetical protein